MLAFNRLKGLAPVDYALIGALSAAVVATGYFGLDIISASAAESSRLERKVEDAELPVAVELLKIESKAQPGNPILVAEQPKIVQSKKPKNDAAAKTYSKRDLDILTRMVYGEARGQSEKLKIASAYVALNRVKKGYGRSIAEVVLQPGQFSCFNKNDPNYDDVWSPRNRREWEHCRNVAQEVLEGKASDYSRGATHYHNDTVNPDWARRDRKTTKIGKTTFYRL